MDVYHRFVQTGLIAQGLLRYLSTVSADVCVNITTAEQHDKKMMYKLLFYRSNNSINLIYKIRIYRS
jgi:hypothetical protein